MLDSAKHGSFSTLLKCAAAIKFKIALFVFNFTVLIFVMLTMGWYCSAVISSVTSERGGFRFAFWPFCIESACSARVCVCVWGCGLFFLGTQISSHRQKALMLG